MINNNKDAAINKIEICLKFFVNKGIIYPQLKFEYYLYKLMELNTIMINMN